MWNKTKEFFGWIAAGLVAVFSVLVYTLKRKNEQLDSANARNALSETDKKSAVLDTEIKNLEEYKKNTNLEIDKDSTKVVDLHTDKKEALEREKNRKPNEVEDYWNKGE